MRETEQHATPARAEADRLMTVCNSCRYCEGLCAVFPAMEMRRAFPDGDVDYLANLCHACGACYVDCQFSPPHEFNVNVPKVLAEVRAESYATHAWPSALAPLWKRNGVVIASICALAVAVFLLGLMASSGPRAFFTRHDGPGAFYALMPHNTMALLFGAAFLFAITAIVMSARNFWRALGPAPGSVNGIRAFFQAAHDAGRLRYLDGGGPGCAADDSGAPDQRRFYHHLTLYGFLLCFAATSMGTLYHYVFGRVAPYAWYDLPVVLGSLGGLGLLIGPLGLRRERLRRPADVKINSDSAMNDAFVAMLFATSATGFAVLLLRSTALLNLTLAIHLGVVLALFVTLPYSKFMHGIYRFLALVRYAQERQAHQ